MIIIARGQDACTRMLGLNFPRFQGFAGSSQSLMGKSRVFYIKSRRETERHLSSILVLIGSTTSPSLFDSGPFEDEPWDGVSTKICGYYGPLLYAVDSEVIEASLKQIIPTVCFTYCVLA